MQTGTRSPIEVLVRVLCVLGLILSAVSALILTPVAEPIPVAQAAGNCPCSIWTTPPTPAETNIFIGYQQEVGVKFQSDTNGYLLGLRFYKATGDTSTTELGHLWSSTGTLLAEVFFQTGSATGWQTAYFDVPVPITANTTYIASYYDTPGYFARTTNGLASAINNSPLHTPSNAGVMSYGPPSSFPTNSGSDNYWVDVVFDSTVPPNTTAPTVTSTSPANGATGSNPGLAISAQFSEALTAATVTASSVQLFNGSTPVPAQVTYNGLTHQAVLVPNSTLQFATTYTAIVRGGASGVKDLAGNALAADVTWTFTTNAAPAPLPNEGYGGPILVVASAGYPFSRYYAEILRAEGFNDYTVTDLSNVTAPLLANYDVVILGEMPLSAAQASLFSDWVTGGGNLIAMRPDKQLAGLLGLTDANAIRSDAYLLVNTAVAPGTGIYSQTMQYHGNADLYTLNGATAVAMLYANATTATANPAVTLQSVGTNGGQAAAFTFDLARSIVYTRQGNPIWAGQDRDGDGIIRPNDMFYGNSLNDPQADWLDLSKVAVPQADEQQRLFANLLLNITKSKKPLPHFWYLPRGEKAVVVMTGDDHGLGGTSGRFNTYLTDSPAGCSVTDWQCVRSTSYVYPNANLGNTAAVAYNSQGFEIAQHIDTGCSTFTPASLEATFASELGNFATTYPGLPAPATNRIHCVAWSDWASAAKVSLNHNIRLDTTYYVVSNPQSWLAAQPGVFTGSAWPMRFADVDGTPIDVYQATTQLADDSGQDPTTWINALLDRAIGPTGYYGAFTINMHTDVAASGGSDIVVAAAQARGVHIISALQLMRWLDARSASSFSNLAWNGNILNFNITPAANANGLQGMLPFNSANGALVSITNNGAAVSYSVLTVKGIQYAFFAATSGAYSATYAIDTTPPTVTNVSPAATATSVPVTSTVAAQFSESIDPATLTSSAFILRDVSSNPVQAALSYDALARQATLAPVVPLGYSARYTATLKGGSTGIKDIAGNPLASDVVWSFTTEAAPVPQTCPCHIWTSPVTPAQPAVSDGQPIEVGVKFRADVNGYITGLRFYKGSGNTGTHTGHLWTSTGALLATATFVNETATDWQTVTFASPVPINANTTYVASYYSPVGYFAYNANYFTSNVNNAPLHALASGVDGPNGVYAYGASAFPTAGSNANYWVDVTFETTAANDTTPPVVQSVSPVNGVTNASPVGNVSATFNEVLTGTSVTTATFILQDAANTLVPASVTYSTGSSTIVLAPSSPLVAGATYTATVVGGSNGVKDQAGNALVNNYLWSFTIATPQTCPCNIWSGSVTPSQPAVSDGQAIEVGVKFRADSDGYITGLRFYKGSANTGTHIGHLWSSTGSLLATATYANETASGWQTVVFTTPVAINANTTYVASYYSPLGFFAYDPAYFSAGVDNAPLRALAAGVDGPNGVYLYGSAAFPTNGTNNNYWADVVFAPSANHAPVAASQALSIPTNAPAAITLSASDADGNPLTYSVTTTPANGALSGTAPNLTYTPNTNFTGTDAFTFQANDGLASSNVATVTITVANVNVPPVANGQIVSTTANTARAITLSATDANNDPLTYAIVTNPALGTLSGTAPNITYTPNANTVGTDTFTFQANDGLASSNVATVTITIVNVNVPPVANGQTVSTTANTAQAITLSATDANNDPLTYAIVTNPALGTLSGTTPNITYTPNANTIGTDTFTFQANDGLASSNVATVTITVNAPAPAISALNPSAVLVGSPAVTLIVTGTGFVNGAVVKWNVSNRTTTFVSSTRLTAAIPAGDLATTGTANVTVFNPAPGGGTSNALTFSINNPAPAISALGPNKAVAGDPALTVIITGTNFVNGSVVRWNGANRTTTYISSTRLTASLPASDLATAGVYSATVFNPAPGGGTSGGITFTVASNLLANGRFELDANGDGRPDSWTSNSTFTRSTAAVHGGSYSGRHFATNNTSYTIAQVVSGLTAGTTYQFAGWTNIPATTDTFTYSLVIVWRNSAGSTLRTDTLKTYTASTGGAWNAATAALTSPANTASASVQMQVTSLNATIYADDFALWR